MEYDYIKLGDCLELMKEIPDGSIDLILCDLPYGTTTCKWDAIIPFEPLWEQYNRIIKDNGAIVLFSAQPFTSKLVSSNYEMFRYEWIWKKAQGVGFLNANKMPLRIHENICVFYKKLPTYNPQFWYSTPYKLNSKTSGGRVYREITSKISESEDGRRYPIDVLEFNHDKERYNSKKQKCGKMRPTQKPVALLEYLIKTYTNEGDVVLDNCMGSGSTCVAAVNTNRHYIGFELDEKYFDIACKRLDEAEEKVVN